MLGLERYARGEDVTTVLPSWDEPDVRGDGVRDVDVTRVQPRTPHTRQAPRREPRPWREPRPRGEPRVRGDVGDPRPAAPAPWAEPAGTPYPPLQQEPGAHVAGPEEQGRPDPRIGRSSRVGTLLALLVGFLGLATTAPLVAWAVFAVWGVLTRTVDRALTGLVLRRHATGPRRSDVPLLVLSSPWHLVAALVSTVLALLLPLGAAAVVAVVFSGFVTSTGTLSGIPVDHPLALGLGSLVGAWLAWWGLGSTALRRGSRTVVRGTVPPGAPTLVVATLALVGGSAMAVYAYVEGGSVSWWPLGPDFDPRSLLPFQL